MEGVVVIATLIVPLVIGIGGFFLQQMFAPKQKDQYGPRISDLNVSTVSPGNPIIQHWGTMKLPGQLLWTSRLIETAHVEQASGGKGGPSPPKSTTYTYAVTFAIGVCDGEVKSVNRIWANSKLLWQSAQAAANQAADFQNAYYAELDRLYNQEGLGNADEAYASSYFFAFNNYRQDDADKKTQAMALAYIMGHPGSAGGVENIPPPNSVAVNKILSQLLSGLQKDEEYQAFKNRFAQIDIYNGSDYQMPNATMSSYVGPGNTPAFRGLCYFVITKLQLEDFGNALPTFTVEVTKQSGSVELRDVINDICVEAGLKSHEYDTSLLPSAIVPGYAITSSTSSREAISNLQRAYAFDAAESDFRLTFKWVNTRPHLVIRREDLGARVDGDPMGPAETITRIAEFELPRRIDLKFQEPVRNYSSNTVHVTRAATLSQALETLDTTIAMTRAMAKSAVEEQMLLRLASRRTLKIMLPRKYIVIEPGDAIYIPDAIDPTQMNAFRCIEQAIGVNGLLDMTFTDHNFHVPLEAIVEDDLEISDPTVPKNSLTSTYLMDMPFLSDLESDEVGFYVVLSGGSEGWLGGALYTDQTGGGSITVNGSAASTSPSTWVKLADNNIQLAHGSVIGKLGPGHAMCWDYNSVIRVYLRNRTTALSSATERDVMTDGTNTCVIGEEYVAYSQARDLGNGLWELKGFLRGLRGTEGQIDLHVEGERFVRVSAKVVKRVKHQANLLNKPQKFRGVTVGDTIDTVEDVTFQDTGVSLKPRAPQLFSKSGAAGSTITIKWIPRNRLRGNWVTNAMPVPMDQPTESYSIDVIQGGIIKATKTATTRTLTYNSASQTSDGVAPGSPVTFRIYQIGNIVGRGFALEAIV